MPDKKPDGLSPEDQAFIEELKAVGYDNPEVYLDGSGLFCIRVVNSLLPDFPTTIYCDIDGNALWDALVETVFHFLTFNPDLDKILDEYGEKDIAEYRRNTEQDPEFTVFRQDQWRFFLRHFPQILLRAYNIAVASSFTGSWLSFYRKQPGDDVNEIETLVRSILDKQIDSFGRYIKQIVETRSKGRPLGSTKAQEEKVQERNEFEERIEGTIRSLCMARGRMPTKTAVAKKLGIGGLNPKTGVDSSLTAFNNKLRRLGIDYRLIVERIKVNK